MHIEVLKGRAHYRWRKVNAGKITTCAETFASKSNAIRAAKADVVQTIKPYRSASALGLRPVRFVVTENAGVTRITWG